MLPQVVFMLVRFIAFITFVTFVHGVTLQVIFQTTFMHKELVTYGTLRTRMQCVMDHGDVFLEAIDGYKPFRTFITEGKM